MTATPASGGPLDGRVVAVTGAGRGLGLATVRVLLEHGARVVAHHRSPAPDLFQLVQAHGDRVHLAAGDVSDEDTARAVIAAAEQLGGLDVLVHNAAITRDELLVRMPTEQWDEVIRVNLRSAFLITKHAVRRMVRRRYGRLIYLSSLAAVIGSSGQSNYAASKAALHGLSQSVAQEYARYNIRSVVLAPGLLDLGLGAALPVEIQQRKLDHSLTGTISGASVAHTIAFLAGPHADFINATTVHINGGIAY
ncbi:SDR family NAD(P)-dependent oxidoreductase [Actinophytocola sp.]|uniref:SDR family NAD(P)-dependent oxidoreductase n=1 Tax=Actinophytocola sp. TaxID=1872138 RepID=UPI002D80C7DE|nr:SDR family NAD(P)-dependent oxidoreductase [Actinophytocola sp.]HET9139276.1 SDR family NAD(P)-dependent oxidoreductase [Actinophytocola sp.]